MEEMRAYARATGISVVWGLATTLFEWSLCRYDMREEIERREPIDAGGFQMGPSRRLYYKERHYCYTD